MDFSVFFLFSLLWNFTTVCLGMKFVFFYCLGFYQDLSIWKLVSFSSRIYFLIILWQFLLFSSCSLFQFSSVQSLSHVRLFQTAWIAARQASLSITISQSSLRLMSIESVMPSSHLILSRPLLLLPPIAPSIRVFSNESALHMRWPENRSFSFSIIPSKEIPGLIFRMDWLHLLAVQGTLKSLLQHHSSKASILRCSPSSQSNSHIHTWPQGKP